MKKIRTFSICFLLIVLTISGSLSAESVRLKDIASFGVEDDIQLIGYGLVIGLDGTGDSKNTVFTMQSLTNMMERMGLTLPADQVKVKNVAAVIVTANLSSFSKIGSKVDCTVSSLGDASSLQGGLLLITPLSGGDGLVYATAQGPVSIGGFNVQSTGGDKVSENYALVGRIPNGAVVERQGEASAETEQINISLINPDFTTSRRLAGKINASIEPGIAVAVDEGNVQLTVPPKFRTAGGVVDLISKVETLEIVPDAVARVVINEKTGTIVAGEHVTLSAVALAHGNLKIEIEATPLVSQPTGFSQGQTVVTRDSNVRAEAEPARIINLEEKAEIGELVTALNEIGASPRDIIAIFQALKVAGALRAELVIM